MGSVGYNLPVPNHKEILGMKKFFVAVLTVAMAFAANAEFKAGAAYRVINPDKLTWVTGGMTADSEATEIRGGDLTARAMALESDGERVVFGSLDLIGFPGVLADRVRAKVKSVKPENILIGVTHSHSGPVMYAFPNEKGEYQVDMDFIDKSVDMMAEAIQEAVANLEPASLKIDTGEAMDGLAFNFYAPALYDPRCHVMQAVDQKGKPIVTLINYASHPEIVGPKMGLLCPDFCGPMYERFEEKTGAMGLYMNSAQGGMVSADNRRQEGRDWDAKRAECVRIGQGMADEALRIVADAPLQDNPAIHCVAKEVPFKVENPRFHAAIPLSKLGIPYGEDRVVRTQMNLVNIGNAQILTIPGEALPNIGFYLKRKMAGEHPFLFGLTNDAYGYILVKEDFDSFDRYEYICRTSLGESAGDTLVDNALALVAESPKPQALN